MKKDVDLKTLLVVLGHINENLERIYHILDERLDESGGSGNWIETAGLSEEGHEAYKKLTDMFWNVNK